MATNKMRPVHPGEVLREEFLVPLRMSANALALALRVPAPRVNDIVRERRAITPDTAMRLARYFDTTAQFWMNLQTAYDLRVAEADMAELIGREVAPRPAEPVAAQPIKRRSPKVRTSRPSTRPASGRQSIGNVQARDRHLGKAQVATRPARAL